MMTQWGIHIPDDVSEEAPGNTGAGRGAAGKIPLSSSRPCITQAGKTWTGSQPINSFTLSREDGGGREDVASKQQPVWQPPMLKPTPGRATHRSEPGPRFSEAANSKLRDRQPLEELTGDFFQLPNNMNQYRFTSPKPSPRPLQKEAADQMQQSFLVTGNGQYEVPSSPGEGTGPGGEVEGAADVWGSMEGLESNAGGAVRGVPVVHISLTMPLAAGVLTAVGKEIAVKKVLMEQARKRLSGEASQEALHHFQTAKAEVEGLEVFHANLSNRINGSFSEAADSGPSPMQVAVVVPEVVTGQAMALGNPPGSPGHLVITSGFAIRMSKLGSIMEQLDALDHSILAVTGFHNPTDQRSLATLHRDRSHQMQCLLEELHLPCTAQGTPRYLIERTPVSPQDNAILSLMSCTAGLSLLARMLKAIHPAQNDTKPLRIIWAVLRNTWTLFDLTRVPGGSEEGFYMSVSNVAASAIGVLGRLHNRRAAADCLAALVSAAHVCGPLARPPKDSLWPLYPPLFVADWEKMPWLDAMIGTLLKRATWLGFGRLIPDAQTRMYWEEYSTKLCTLIVSQLDMLKDKCQAAEAGGMLQQRLMLAQLCPTS